MTDHFDQARQLRKLADDLEVYARYRPELVDDLVRALGVEVAVLGANIVAGEDADQIKNITIRPGAPPGAVYAVEETHGSRGTIRRLAARLQRSQ